MLFLTAICSLSFLQPVVQQLFLHVAFPFMKWMLFPYLAEGSGGLSYACEAVCDLGRKQAIISCITARATKGFHPSSRAWHSRCKEVLDPIPRSNTGVWLVKSAALHCHKVVTCCRELDPLLAGVNIRTLDFRSGMI